MVALLRVLRTVPCVNTTAAPSSPDLEKAIAALVLTHGLVKPKDAVKMIKEVRAGSPRTLMSQLLEAVPETDLLRAITAELGIRFYDLYSPDFDLRVDEAVLERVSMDRLKSFSALPLVSRTGNIVVVVANPSNADMLDYLRSRFSTNLNLALASKLQIQNKLLYLNNDSSPLVSTPTASLPGSRGALGTTLASNLPREATTASPTQAWVDTTLARAVAEGASDIHFLFNFDKSLLLSFRVDGILRQQRVPADLKSMEVIGSILARCETMDSSNYREPQDGTFSFDAAGRRVDARVGMLPQSGGPTVVIRLLDSSNMRTRLDDMGFNSAQLELMRKAITAPQGTILVCGPTGSGKSTTLYGLLREVDAISRRVYTVEEPIEYRLPHIGQTEIRSDLGERSLTFARALRTILRLDPDIILVGEVRDSETAEVAMRAGLTGHVVLSTIHSNSALGAYARLSDLELKPYVVSQAVNLIIAQRLIRKLHDCAARTAPTPDEVAILEAMNLEVPETVGHPVGCPGCNGSGFRGRMAVVEMVDPSRDLKAMVASGANRDEMLDAAVRGGYVPMLRDGYRHLLQGRTTVTELTRVLISEED
jgi:type IV pilus assembly protein PilB